MYCVPRSFCGLLKTHCAVPEKIHTTPWKVIANSFGRGVLKVKILKVKYETTLEFPGGMGLENKKPSVGKYGVLELHIKSKLTKFDMKLNI